MPDIPGCLAARCFLGDPGDRMAGRRDYGICLSDLVLADRICKDILAYAAGIILDVAGFFTGRGCSVRFYKCVAGGKFDDLLR